MWTRKCSVGMGALIVALAAASGTSAGARSEGARGAAPRSVRSKAAANKPAAASPLESKDILAREPRTQRAEVLHVLVGWKELAANYRGDMDARGKSRSKDAADRLAREILSKARAGGDFRALMKEFSEDTGSSETGTSYTATPDAGLVAPFKALALRLDVGETGVVETTYGWHVIQRVK